MRSVRHRPNNWLRGVWINNQRPWDGTRRGAPAGMVDFSFLAMRDFCLCVRRFHSFSAPQNTLRLNSSTGKCAALVVSTEDLLGERLPFGHDAQRCHRSKGSKVCIGVLECPSSWTASFSYVQSFLLFRVLQRPSDRTAKRYDDSHDRLTLFKKISKLTFWPLSALSAPRSAGTRFALY